eukprot:984806-Rhodomonas_salina.1
MPAHACAARDLAPLGLPSHDCGHVRAHAFLQLISLCNGFKPDPEPAQRARVQVGARVLVPVQGPVKGASRASVMPAHGTWCQVTCWR